MALCNTRTFTTRSEAIVALCNTRNNLQPVESRRISDIIKRIKIQEIFVLSTARSEAIVALCSTRNKREAQRDLDQLRPVEARKPCIEQVMSIVFFSIFLHVGGLRV